MTRSSDDAVDRLFRDGMYAWAGLAGLIVAWDWFAPETMTSAFGRCRSRSRASEIALAGAWTLITLHLFAKLPEKSDPIALLGRYRPRACQVPAGFPVIGRKKVSWEST